jgi:hypothetical protein
VLSNESIEAAAEAERASKEMSFALGGLVNTLGAALLPTATKTFRGIAKWVGENRAQIKAWAESSAKWITNTAIPAFFRLVHEIQELGGKALWLVNAAAKLTGGFGNLAAVLVGLRLAPLAITFGKIGIEATKAAIAIFKYVTAKRAANAAGGDLGATGGGAGGVAGKAIPLIGAGLAADAAIQQQLGKVNLGGGLKWSDVTNSFGVFDKAKAAEAIAARQHELLEQFKQENEQKAAAGSASTLPVTQAGGRTVEQHSNVFHINDVKSRDDLAGKMDQAKQQALDAYDQREAKRKRVSFAR